MVFSSLFMADSFVSIYHIRIAVSLLFILFESELILIFKIGTKSFHSGRNKVGLFVLTATSNRVVSCKSDPSHHLLFAQHLLVS